MKLTDDWEAAISAYVTYLRASGAPETTIRARREHLAHLARRVNVGPWSLGEGELLAYAGAQQWARETRRSRRTTLLGFYRWARAAGHVVVVTADVLPKVPASQPPTRPAPDNAYRAALLAAPPRETLMLRLAAEVGLRRAEVAKVHTRDIFEDLAGWSLRVHGKGGRERVVPLPGSLARVLVDVEAGYVFPGLDGGHLSPRWVGRLIADLLPEGWTMHTLRHRFATRAYALRSDILMVQELLGHSSPGTTRRYVEITRTPMRELIEELEAHDVRYA